MLTLDETQRAISEDSAARHRDLRRVFVTGGSGFIGQRLLAVLREQSIAAVRSRVRRIPRAR